jgi:FixJ family two-component response regulator
MTRCRVRVQRDRRLGERGPHALKLRLRVRELFRRHPGRSGTAAARLVISGMNNRDVADTLVVSPKTVTYHLGHVFAKLGVKSRAQCSMWRPAGRCC